MVLPRFLSERTRTNNGKRRFQNITNKNTEHMRKRRHLGLKEGRQSLIRGGCGGWWSTVAWFFIKGSELKVSLGSPTQKNKKETLETGLLQVFHTENQKYPQIIILMLMFRRHLLFCITYLLWQLYSTAMTTNLAAKRPQL